MANVQIDIAPMTAYEDITSSVGGTQTNGIRVVFADTLTEEEIVITLETIVETLTGKNKISWP